MSPWDVLTRRGRGARGYLADGAVHNPNAIVGTFKYNNPLAWSPKTAGFIAAGGSYLDPVFGETVIRLTATDNPLVQLTSENYAHNGLINADNTRYLDFSAVGKRVRSIPGGAITHSGLPFGITNGTDCIFDPVNPDIYYYFTGATLHAVTLLGGGGFNDAVLKTFSGALDTLGSTVDFVDATGRYFVISVAGIINIWDSVADQLFSGAFAFSSGTGWVGITPSGNFLVYTLNNHTVRALDLVGKSIGPAIDRHGLGGDHGDVVSATDGHDYLVRYDGNFSVEKTRLDTGTKTPLITESPTAHAATHFSGVGKGSHRNWVFASFEYTDGIDQVVSYQAFDNEIIMLNVVDGGVRRICHHRGRNGSGNYYLQQRVCASWDGTVVLWGSNFNDGDTISGAPYQDLYYVNPPYPASEGGPPPPPPTSGLMAQTRFVSG